MYTKVHDSWPSHPCLTFQLKSTGVFNSALQKFGTDASQSQISGLGFILSMKHGRYFHAEHQIIDEDNQEMGTASKLFFCKFRELPYF